MKRIMLLLLLTSSLAGGAQSLKEALYGGKLKTDSGSVLRKGDDLSSKIDTSRRKPAEPEKAKPAVKLDSAQKKTLATGDSATVAIDKADNSTLTKDNNKLWKQFMDTVVSSLKSEVMSSKKMKKGDYYVMVDYTIGTDGQVTIGTVFVTPENKSLEIQVKERFGIDTPKLNPVLSGNGTPRKVVKRANFTLTKD